jgi:2-keto-3-deoxy-L-rhamnonate aldolase RhmA
MQAANRLLNALRTEHGLSFGAWQMLPGANHGRMMARSGYDWICVDTEHGNIAGTSLLSSTNYFDNMELRYLQTGKCMRPLAPLPRRV